MLGYSPVYKKLITVTLFLCSVLIVSVMLGLTIGSSGRTAEAWKVLLGNGGLDSTLEVIIWQLRWPRVVLAATVGATLSLGGLVFQALLRNPLAEPYILGISGGSAVGGDPRHSGRVQSFPRADPELFCRLAYGLVSGAFAEQSKRRAQ
jgi:ABC-type Fe3+-siderophore transport system permease subunit